MLYTRYAFAAEHSRGRAVLEVACGAGQGLGMLARVAARVVGGDYTESLVRQAHQHYRERISVVQLNAQALPFADRFFDVIVLFEALYYLPAPELWLAECRRVLRPSGELIVCCVNKDWPEFNSSPLSTRYYSPTELRDLLCEGGFDAKLFGAFPAESNGFRERAVSLIRRMAIRLNLIPRTMRGKGFWKRLFYGPLHAVPSELQEGDEKMATLVALQPGDGRIYKIIYALGTAPARPQPAGTSGIARRGDQPSSVFA